MKRCVENRIESSCIEKKKTKVLEQEHHLEEDESYKNIIEKKQVQSSTSALLGCMIGKQQSNIDDFFKEIYQKVPSLYHVSRKDRETCEVLKMLYFMGWEGVCDMLHKSQSNLEKYTTNAMDLDKEHGGREETATTRSDAACRAYSTIDSNTLPLFFRNQEPLQLDEMKNVYGNSPFAAYLDGCSIVNNHADLLSAPLAALCLDIQKSLPHAYINTYLTPPKAAAVSAHADDRDVFVLQVLGEKQWKVYSEVPIPYPSTNEQVGKNGLPIPPHVLEKEPMYDITLRPGDILYLPRGFVHEAATSTSEPSFHCTVALATHDWSLSTIVSKIVQEEISKHSKFRMAIHPDFGRRRRRKDVCSLDDSNNNNNNKTHVEELSNQISDAMECITSKCTVKQVVDILEEKYKSHNDRVEPIRQSLIHDFQTTSSTVAAAAAAAVVGPTAAKRVGMNSTIRASTPQERSMAPLPVATHGRGLTVREEICDGLLYLLDMLKKNDTRIVRVSQLREYYYSLTADHLDHCDNKMICDLSILSFVKCCVELGALALID